MWLKAYLNFSPTHPKWATVTDLILAATACPGTIACARQNPFLQTWEATLRGPCAKLLNPDIMCMLKAAKKHKTNLAAIRVSINVQSQLPTWYHLALDPRPITNAASKCLLTKHNTITVADLLCISVRLQNHNEDSLHFALPNYPCTDCNHDRSLECINPHCCTAEALEHIHKLYPKLNPLRLSDPHDNLSLTRHCKAQNIFQRAQRGEILFDPTMTCKESLAECFHIFTNQERLSRSPAQCHYSSRIRNSTRTVTVYTDGACFNNGKYNAQCVSGIYFGPNNNRNLAFCPSGNLQSNQAAEIIAIYKAALVVPRTIPLRIISDSLYAINGLT